MAGDFTKEEALKELSRRIKPGHWHALQMPPQRAHEMIKQLLPRSGIVDFRPLPIVHDETLVELHIIIVTVKSILYCHIANGKFSFRFIPFAQFRLTVQVGFDCGDKGADKANSIVILCDVGDFDVDGKPKIHEIEVAPGLLTRLINLVCTINRLREEQS